MDSKLIVDTAIAKIVSPSRFDRLVDVNRPFVLAMANEAYHKVESAAMWKFSEAESEIQAQANQRNPVSLPDNLGIPLLVQRKRDGYELVYWDDRQQAFDPNEKGEPKAYSMWNGELRFWPLPRKDETYLIRYYLNWPDLVDSDADEPVIPETWHHLLHEYAAGKLAQRLPPTGDRFLPHSLAQPYIESFELGLQRMLQSDLVLKTFDQVPWHDHREVLNPEYY